MNSTLLHSQLETLQPPEHALQIDVTLGPEEVASQIQPKLDL
jgi:gluconate kinase